MLRLVRRALALAAVASFPLAAQPSEAAFVKANYVKHEYHIAMRDGVKLYAAVYVPRDASDAHRYPMVMQRTCYSVGPYGPDQYPEHIGPNDFMEHEKYIFVYEDVRGRYMSEGEFVNVRPFIENKTKPTDIDEASDTYDTIDYLLKNVAFNNGRVGQWGISYPGFYTSMGALSGHPALKAVSPQAPVTDFYFEDFHHNGALTQAYFYTYPLFGIQHPGPTSDNWWASKMVSGGLPDDYTFQLALGPLKNTTEKYYKDNFFWREIIDHPNYDAFWQARAIAPHLKDVKPALLAVGGWFDAEDLYGPLKVFKSVSRNHPQSWVGIVEGPFRHGGWSARGVTHTVHGDIYFGDSLETFFQREIEMPFFHHFLKGSGDANVGLPVAYMFDTGKKRWEKFPGWPAPGAETRSLYQHVDGSLGWSPAAQRDTFAEYVSDPAKPVPSRCLVPTIQGLTMYQYMSDDQRCFSSRPDVLTFRTEPLTDDVTLGGEITAKLVVSTTGTDADFVVKLIDVYPPDEKDSPYQPYKNVHMGGYQQMVRSEIMRGRWRKSFATPEPFVPGEASDVTFPLQDVLHTFRKGHRIMVQIQSSWFPAFDRNPQTFVPNIYLANDGDFRKATERVWLGSARPSVLQVQVLK